MAQMIRAILLASATAATFFGLCTSNPNSQAELSKSQVSRLCSEIDERVEAFLERPIGGKWPYIWLDATYVKARRGHHIVSVR